MYEAMVAKLRRQQMEAAAAAMPAAGHGSSIADGAVALGPAAVAASSAGIGTSAEGATQSLAALPGGNFDDKGLGQAGMEDEGSEDEEAQDAPSVFDMVDIWGGLEALSMDSRLEVGPDQLIT